MITGITPVKVNRRRTDHTAADISHQDTTKLTSGSTGRAQILWIEDDVGDDRWALVQLGRAPARPTGAGDAYQALQILGTGSNKREVYDYIRLHGDPV